MFKDLVSYLDENIKRFPNKPAIVADGRTVTYQQLQEQSDRMAAYILANGADEKIIPLVFERCPDMIIAMVAVLKSGYAFLPISPLTPCERKQFILKDSQAKLLLTNNPDLIKISHLDLNIITVSDIKPFVKPDLPALTENHLSYVMYTSGSTGNPKGVLLEHGAMMNLFLSLISELKLSEQEQILALTDYTFDISLIELLLPLMLGATIILTEQGAVADGLKLRNYLSNYDISLMQATPISWEILLKQGWRNNGKIKILVGGEKFSTRLATWLDYSKANIWNMYGPTETCMWSMCFHLGKSLSFDSVPLGMPILNTTIQILDENLYPTAPGQEGELYIGGEGLARGYLNNSLLTQQKFITHPHTNERLYRTGDRVIVNSDEEIYFIGRVDEQLKFGGIRVESGEIENIIEKESFVKKAIVKLHEQAGYYKILAAYIEIDEEKANGICLSIAKDGKHNPFRSIYNEIYLHADKYKSENINTCGWVSSFTNKMFSAEELKESYNFIEEVIKKSDLSNVLEIGAGTGYLLSRFVDKAKQYTILEISDQSINYMKNNLNELQREKVIFRNQSILDVNEYQEYSCIIINSVIQYFPSVDYLITAIKKIIKSAKKNSKIIIGDVRSTELLEVFLLKKNKKHTYYKSRESELVLSPDFFVALQKEIPSISHIDISVKHGKHDNELNYFRYDAILHVDQFIEYRKPLSLKYDGDAEDYLLNYGKEHNELQPIIIKNIPNLIFDKEVRVLGEKSISDEKNISLPNNIGFLLNLDMDEYEKIVMYSKGDPVKNLDIHLYPKENGKVIRCKLDGVDYASPRAYCREPFNPWLQSLYFDKVKQTVASHLASWVTPSMYVWVEKWPLTINSKVDKKALQLPSNSEPISEMTSNDKTLVTLQKIWKNTVGENWILDKDFWEHGISSLYLHFFLATVNATYTVDIGYHDLHQYHTPSQLAHHIDTLQSQRDISYSLTVKDEK